MNHESQALKKTVYLIDGSSFLYRAFYGLRPLHTSNGLPVQAVYGFCRAIIKLVQNLKPDFIALVWDSKGKTIRHDMYPDYKATRQAAPQDLFTQKELIVEYASIIGLAQCEAAGYEADDVLASLTKRLIDETDYTVVLVTTDKDLTQLISDRVKLYDAFEQKYTDVQAFIEKYGFEPSKMPLYLSLVGDSSDNIPGVAGIGPKGATALVQQFNNLDELYSVLESILPMRLRNALIGARNEAYLSHQLVQLAYPPVNCWLSDFEFNLKKLDDAQSFFARLEFKSLLQKQTAEIVVQSVQSVSDTLSVIIVTTQEQLSAMVTAILNAGHCAIDTETAGKSIDQLQLVGISCATQEGFSWYIPVAHQQGTQLPLSLIKQCLEPVLQNTAIKKYFHNAKFDLHALAQAGITVSTVAFDTLIAASLVRNDGDKIGLKALSLSFFNERMQTFSEVTKNGSYQDFSFVPIVEAAPYAASDAHQTLKLVPILQQLLIDSRQEALFTSIEMPLMHVLYRMERRGIIVDDAELVGMDAIIEHELLRIIGQFQQLVSTQYHGINLNSPKQLRSLLFDYLQLRPAKKTSSGQYSTDQEVLQELAFKHEVPLLIVRYRELMKLRSTYIQGLLEARNGATGRVHTTFSQTKTATGRLSSSDPNLQNVPTVKSRSSVTIRSAFRPTPGYTFIAADYNQIELRVVAHLSGDEALRNAFLNNVDIHAHTASKIFNRSTYDITKEQRQIGKQINFSILYGLTPYGLSQDLGISLAEAKAYIDTYYEQHPGLVAWMESVIAFTKQHGYVETAWGRRRYIPGIHEKNKNLYEAACRMAINTQAQGTAAELMKLGMLSLQKMIVNASYSAHMILQIHDELLFEVEGDAVLRAEKDIKHTLESVVEWTIPLRVGLQSGADWAQASK